MILVIWAHICGGGHTVGHVVKACDIGNVPDVAVRKAYGAQGLAVGLNDCVTGDSDFLGEGEHRGLAGVKIGGTPVHHQHFTKHWITRELANSLAMSCEAVKAFVDRGHRDGDHLALKLAQAALGEHQVIVERCEGVELVDVKGIGLQHVWHEAELVLTDIKVFLRLVRERIKHRKVKCSRLFMAHVWPSFFKR